MKEKNFERIITGGFLVLATLVPVLFSPIFKSVFSAPKFLFFQFLVLLLITVFFVYLCTAKRISFWQTKWEQILMLYVATIFLSGIFSINIYSSFFGIEGRFIGTLFMLHIGIMGVLFLRFFPKKKIPALLISIWITSVVVALYSILQYYSIIDFNSINWSQDPTKRAFGTLGHANHLGAYLATGIAIAIGLFTYLKKYWHKATILVLSLIPVYGLMLSASRGAFAALIITLLVSAILVLRIQGIWYREHALKILVVIVALGVSLIIAYPSIQTTTSKLPVVERSLKTIEFLDEGNVPDRISWWKSSFDIFIDYPLTGTGFSTFKDAYNKYRNIDYRVPGDKQDNITPESAHNELINILATQGIVGLLFYLLLLITAIAPLVNDIWHKSLIESREEKYLRLSLLAGILIYIFQVQLSFAVISTLVIFHLLLFAAVVLAHKGKNKKLKLNKQLRISVGLIVIAFVVSSSYLTAKRGLAEYNLAQAETSVHASEKESFYQKAILNFPWEYSYYNEFADYNLEAIMQNRPDIDFNKYINSALTNYQKAISINPEHPAIHANYGIALFTYANYQKLLGATDAKVQEYQQKAKTAFEEAIKLGPNNPSFAYHYGLALEKIGEKEAARSYYEEALKIRPEHKESLEKIKNLMNSK